jgi:tetratricopeptide (TPR) repeat protein
MRRAALLMACTLWGGCIRAGAPTHESDQPEQTAPSPEAIQRFVSAELAAAAHDDASAVVELEYAAVADNDPYIFLRIAEEDARLGRLDDAEDAIKSALRLEPNDCDAQVVEGALCSSRRDLTGALAAWAAAEKADPTDEEPYLLRYAAFTQAGQPDQATGELRALVKADPSSDEGHYRLALSLFEAGDTDGAEGEDQAALRLAPGRSDALSLLGQIDTRRGDLASAIDAYQRAQSVRGDRALASHAVGVLIALGRPAEARQAAQAADDGSVDAFDRVAQGRLYLAAGEPDRARALADEVLLVSDDPAAELLDGDARAASGDVDGALDAWAKVPDDADEAATAREHAATRLCSVGRAGEAVALLQPLVVARPEDADLIAALAAAQVAAGTPDGGIATASVAATAHQGAQSFEMALTATYEASGNLTRALDLGHKLVNQHPNDGQCARLLAEIDVAAGRVDDAEPLARSAVADLPDDPRVLSTLGDVLLRQHESESALPFLQRSVAADPTRPDALDLLGEASMKDPVAARGALTAALALGPDVDLKRRITDDLHDLDAQTSAQTSAPTSVKTP